MHCCEQYDASFIRLRSSNKATMCLTSDGDRDGAKLFYSDCSERNLNQVFVFKRLESDLFSSFGRIYSGMANYDLCIEMHSTHNDQVFMHSNCWDTFEILQNGALQNIEEGKCLGFGVEKTKVTAVDCDSEYAEIWAPNTSILILPTIEDWASLKTLGYCVGLEDGKNAFNGMKAKLSSCNSYSLSQ